MQLVMNAKDSILIYGASSNDIDASYKDAARQIGRLIAQRGLGVVCGGGRSGLMAAAIDGALEVGGRAVGVLPEFMVRNGWQHRALTEMIVTADMHERKRTMASMSIAAIALPGGCGTLEELMEIITWRQLGLYAGNVVIFNQNGYYDPLIEMLSRTISMGFMRGDHSALWSVALTPDEAVAKALAAPSVSQFTQKID